MSVVTVSCGSDWNSSHVQRAADALGPRTVKSHVASGVRGAGPAEEHGEVPRFVLAGREPAGGRSGLSAAVFADSEAGDGIVAAIGRKQKLSIRREDDTSRALEGVRCAFLAADR